MIKGKIASIVQAHNKYQIVINRGLAHNVTVGNYFYVINVELNIPIIIAKIRIVALFENFCFGILLPYKEDGCCTLKVRIGDEVMRTNSISCYSEIIIVRKSNLMYNRKRRG